MVVVIRTSRPMMASHLAPKRSNSLPVTGIRMPITSEPGSSRNPDSMAVYPRAFCRYSGSSIISAYITIVTAILIIVVKENILYLKARRSRSGFEDFSCCQVNNPSARTPTPSDKRTSVLNQPALPARLKPYSKVPKPMVETATLSRSSLA
ncbi:hypothetical protein D3C73_1263740 [compost metagenome]